MRVCLALLLCASLPVFAARPLTTEDAEVLENKACQVEAWVDRSRVETQAWLVPACNFGAGIEWQAAFARSRFDGSSRFTEATLQAKTAWGALAETGWSIGAVAGVTRRPQNEIARGWDNPYAIGLASWMVAGTTVHANVGWLRDGEERRSLLSWGVAVEKKIRNSFTVLAEAFGDERGNPFFRAGVRFTARKGLDLDLSFVTRAEGNRSDRLISAGFLFETGRFLP